MHLIWYLVVNPFSHVCNAINFDLFYRSNSHPPTPYVYPIRQHLWLQCNTITIYFYHNHSDISKAYNVVLNVVLYLYLHRMLTKSTPLHFPSFLMSSRPPPYCHSTTSPPSSLPSPSLLWKSTKVVVYSVNFCFRIVDLWLLRRREKAPPSLIRFMLLTVCVDCMLCVVHLFNSLLSLHSPWEVIILGIRLFVIFWGVCLCTHFVFPMLIGKAVYTCTHSSY